MQNYRTKEGKSVSLKFLTVAKAGKEFSGSVEGDEFFSSSEGDSFLCSVDGQAWLGTADGIGWYISRGKRWIQGYESGKKQILKILEVDESSCESKVDFLVFILSWLYGDMWRYSDYGRGKFIEYFCEVGYELLMTPVGIKWSGTDEFRKFISDVGNKFLLSKGGKMWLFSGGNDFIFTEDGRRWILREGEWIFGEVNFYISRPYEFLNWIVMTPKSFAIKFFNSEYMRHIISDECMSWFDTAVKIKYDGGKEYNGTYGDFLFDNGYINNSVVKKDTTVIYKNFNEYVNDIIDKY